MFEDTQESGEQLFAADHPESVSDGATNSGNAEESKEELELERPKAAEEEKRKQIEVWQRKVDSGEVSIKDIPPAQKWIAKFLRKPVQEQPDIEVIIERKMAEKEDVRDYNRSLDDLRKMSLSPLQKSELQKEFDDLRERGIAKSVAIEKAMKYVGIARKDTSSEDRRKEAMKLPTPGYAGGAADSESSPFDEKGNYDMKKGTAEERMKFLEAQRTSRIGAQRRKH